MTVNSLNMQSVRLLSARVEGRLPDGSQHALKVGPQHPVDHGKAVAIPLDGTGPSYTANFGASDLENIRAVKQGDVLVEEDTDLFRTVARGSDGSRAFVKGHAHFTVNANGETTVQLDSARMVCT